jgi:hypothetical protein
MMTIYRWKKIVKILESFSLIDTPHAFGEKNHSMAVFQSHHSMGVFQRHHSMEGFQKESFYEFTDLKIKNCQTVIHTPV